MLAGRVSELEVVRSKRATEVLAVAHTAARVRMLAYIAADALAHIVEAAREAAVGRAKKQGPVIYVEARVRMAALAEHNPDAH